MPTLSGGVFQFDWASATEDSKTQRKAYMKFIKARTDISSFPSYGWHDVQPTRNLLDLEIGQISLRGTCDVVLCRKADIAADTIRHNILTAVELKKQVAQANVAQGVAEHIVASICSPESAVVTVLTDLRNSWQFWWLSNTARRIMTYKVTNSKEGWFLLSHCIPGSTENVSSNLFPDEFLTRSSWNDLPSRKALRPVEEEKGGIDDDSNDDAEGNQSEDPTAGSKENAASTASSSTAAAVSSKFPPVSSSSSTSTKGRAASSQHCHQFSMAQVVGPLRELYGYHDVANQLDFVDLVDDPDEQRQIIKQYVLDHQFPRSWTSS